VQLVLLGKLIVQHVYTLGKERGVLIRSDYTTGQLTVQPSVEKKIVW